MPNSVMKGIDAVLQEKHMLRHRFYQAWSEGTLSQEVLKEYACQYYHFVKDFPRMVSAVHSNTDDIVVRQALLLNLIDEEQGPQNHPALWMRFANAVGASPDEVRATQPLPTTFALVQTMMDFCRNGPFQVGAATLYAYESQIPEVSRAKIEGLKKFYGITDPEAIRFFLVHQKADVYHSRSEREMIERWTPQDLHGAVEHAAATTAHALWQFLDGVSDAYLADRTVRC